MIYYFFLKLLNHNLITRQILAKKIEIFCSMMEKITLIDLIQGKAH